MKTGRKAPKQHPTCQSQSLTFHLNVRNWPSVRPLEHVTQELSH